MVFCSDWLASCFARPSKQREGSREKHTCFSRWVVFFVVRGMRSVALSYIH